MARPLALITGASSGIGLELAKVFAAGGHDLIIVSDNRDKLEDAADEINAVADEAHIDIMEADLSEPDGPRALYAAVRKRDQEVDVLVNNAGVGVWGEFHQTSLADELRMIQLNAASVVQLTKLFLNDMLRHGAGKILITASQSSVAPTALATVYAATKAFVYSFALGLREEVRDHGIVVTALMPGSTRTNWFERAGAGHTDTAHGPLADPAKVARAGYDALMANDDHIVTPLKDKLMVAAAKLMPDRMKVQWLS